MELDEKEKYRREANSEELSHILYSLLHQLQVTRQVKFST